MWLAIAMALLAVPLGAQAPADAPGEKPLLQNLGKPMRVAFACTEEDMLGAGMTCTEDEPCPVYLELSAAEAVGNKMFAAGNLHSTETTLYSILLASEDGGKTWREPFERQRACSLDRIQFVDFETGWVSGQVLQPLPNDPFLLVTTDGGKSWRRRPVFNESRAGAIQQFWFASPTEGALLIKDGPRYERYESPNGGETWMVREVSDRPIRWKPSAAAASMRVRADGPSKSFCIERREGERWTAVASFLVAAGACQPATRELTPPPEPEPETAQPPEPPAPPRRPARPPTLRRPPQ